MDVLERDAHRAALDECLATARGGDGRLVFVAGEAGIGKTTLVDGFCAGVRGARVAVGVCDDLDTPRPLGPVLEIAERLGLTDPHDDVSTILDATARLSHLHRPYAVRSPRPGDVCRLPLAGCCRQSVEISMPWRRSSSSMSVHHSPQSR
jgi:hypothetical protein